MKFCVFLILLVTFSFQVEQNAHANMQNNQDHHAHHHHHHQHQQVEAGITYAISILQPDNNSGVTGVVRMRQVEGEKTRIVAEVHGLQDGLHGFHIHEFGNLLQGCLTAGPHYNPHGQTHGDKTSEVRHAGDLGNIISENGEATFDWEDPQVQLTGPYSVIGRSAVVHAQEDDLGKTDHPDSKTTGNSGARLACGVIGLSAPFQI